MFQTISPCFFVCCWAVQGREWECFLDKGDWKSTSDLCKHMQICWGSEAVEAADNTHDIDAACEILSSKKKGWVNYYLVQMDWKGKGHL